jgi:hypothetical protein
MGRTVILDEQVNTDRDIATARDIAGTSRNASNKRRLTQKSMRDMQGRSAILWMAVAMLAMTWASETRASPDQARHLADTQHATAARNLDSVGTAGDGDFGALPPSRGGNDKSVQVAQATTSDTGQSPEQEHHWAETLSCELTNARRDIELLQHLEQGRDRAEWLEQGLAAARRDVETQTALTAKAVEETAGVKQAEQSGAAELQKSLQQERERSARLEQDLTTARHGFETQTALAAKAGEEASQLKHAGESGAAELQKSLQQERERSARLEQDLAAAHRDVETQTALAAEASEEASRRKQAADASATELRQSMQKERERADALAQGLSMTRSAIYAYEAQARKAGDEAAELRQAVASGAPLLRKSAQDARDRAERLEQDLATARRDLETQTALAAKASEEAARARQTAERDSAALRSSLQQERVRAERLERDLALAQSAAPNVVTIGSTARKEPVEAGANPIADPRPAASARGDAQPNSEEAAVAAGLVARATALLRQGDIGAARIVLERAVEMGSAQASFSLAETFDPLILAKWGTYGTRGDAIKAQDLYAKADAAGIQEAKARFEALRR